MQWCAQIWINPTGKRPGRLPCSQPPPKKDARGSKEEANVKIVAGDGSPNLGAFHCSGQPNQYDRDRGHIGVCAVVPVRRQAIALRDGHHGILAFAAEASSQ